MLRDLEMWRVPWLSVELSQAYHSDSRDPWQMLLLERLSGREWNMRSHMWLLKELVLVWNIFMTDTSIRKDSRS